MHSSLIGKIEKARRYAQERDRAHFLDFTMSFRGEHDVYTVALKDGRLQCSCHFYAGWGICSHTMALRKILGEMLPKDADAAAQPDETQLVKADR